MKSNTEVSKQIDFSMLRKDMESGQYGGLDVARVIILLDHIDGIEKENASLKQDAARYRFLRDCEWRETALEPLIRLQLNALWDSKIDTAMEASNAKAY